MFTLYKFQFTIQTFFIFFQKATKISKSGTSYNYVLLKDDSLVSYSAQFLSENLRVVLIIFYVNFLSSRKYDWNVAPKDLEKIRRAHGACVVFF